MAGYLPQRRRIELFQTKPINIGPKCWHHQKLKAFKKHASPYCFWRYDIVTKYFFEKHFQTKWVNFDKRDKKQYDFREKSPVFQSFSLKLADMYLIISFLKYHIVKREMNKFITLRKKIYFLSKVFPILAPLNSSNSHSTVEYISPK